MTVCSRDGCPNLTGRAGKCDDCRAEADRERGSGSARGYTAKWARFRKRYLGDHPACECRAGCRWHDGDGICRTLATDLDHIDGTGRDGPRAYDETNLASLCHRCHSSKTVHSDGGFGR